MGLFLCFHGSVWEDPYETISCAPQDRNGLDLPEKGHAGSMAEWRLSLPVLYLFSEASVSVHLRARQAAPRALAMPVMVVNIKFPAGTDFPHSDQLE